MTSGRGILHEELPRRGPSGNIYGFQLWVNLPSALKMGRPRYQEVAAASIPTYSKDGIVVRVVAGTVGSFSGPVREIAASPVYLDVTLAAGRSWQFPVERDHTLLAYVFEGEGEFGGTAVGAVRLVRFGPGEHFEAKAGTSATRFMLIAGKPFGEPIAPYGPFVMNTVQEIQQTLIELRNGTFIQNA
jgi:redox-sensitive bicupin YhaK (pirin superfamily)